MSYRFIRQSRRAILGACLVAACGGFYACTDNYDLDKPGNTPEWLGQSIYAELSNPDSKKLTGTFTNYLRLIDDLGEKEILSQTGSRTVFAANDEAFERFYANNSWGVHKYEDLTLAMKKQLLYASMLDNALLVEMLSNVSNGDNAVTKGMAMKHMTAASSTDSITFLHGVDMPENNSYWDGYRFKGMNIVMDNTVPMMVHFTNEQMVTNSITTTGENSDFEVITGKPYTDGLAFIFKDPILKDHENVTCQNGYIHQMEDVIVPPGNLGQVLRASSDTKLFSRMLDRFSVPVYDGTTTANYIDYCQQNGITNNIDSIFQLRYFSSRSQGLELNVDPNGITMAADELLPYDPGWNQYYSASASSLTDMAAMFVPTDAAMTEFFLNGAGKAVIENFLNGNPNDAAHLEENIDNIPKDIVCALLSNLMKSSFVQTVPSKFGNILDDASDPMGLTLANLNKTTAGAYDVRIANNGVIYILNKVFAPAKYVAVSAPALLDKSLSVINWAIQDKRDVSAGGLGNFYAYLLAMSANYGLFLPDDNAFGSKDDKDSWYVDPASLGTDKPRALRFWYDNKAPYIHCSSWSYDKENHTVGDSIASISVANVKTQLVDILNYHTVVLEKGEKIGANHYYKTKHGGAIYVENANMNGVVAGGGQIDNGLPKATITNVYDNSESGNGVAYRLNHIIQAPQNSVYSILSDSVKYPQFTKFFDLCQIPSDVMTWAGIGAGNPQKQYTVFTAGGLGKNDRIVNFFNSYNYTVYAPDNDAMTIAHKNGLPTVDDLEALFNADYNNDERAEKEAKAKAFKMIQEITRFIRYHMQDNSVFADNKVASSAYQTACVASSGMFQKLNVSGGDGKLVVRDNYAIEHGQAGQTIQAGSTGKLVNCMTRDYTIESNAISTSSFAVIHEISRPLNYHENTERYDEEWKDNTPATQARLMRNWKSFLKAQSEGKKFY